MSKQAQEKAQEVKVLGAGRGWLAVYKPSGVSVHNDPQQDICARLNSRIEADTALARKVGLDATWGVHAVHRLDRDTSGVLLVATQAPAFTALSNQFSQHTVGKRYLAVVHGRLQSNAGSVDVGVWSWPLSAKAGGRSQPAGTGKRRPSCTRYRVKGLSERYTLLVCEPVSGRQHQIRRHAKMAGHPVVGDRRYGSKRALKYLQATYPDVRLALHAWQLSFVPPEQASDQPLTLTAEPVPTFMRRLISGAPDGRA